MPVLSRAPNPVAARTITFERQLEQRPLLQERATVVVAGDQVSSLWRKVVVPDAAERAERVREGPRDALGAVGLLRLALGVIGGFITLLQSLRDGSARIAEPAKIAVLIAAGALVTLLLDERWIIAYWDPLVPKWISGLNVLADRAVNGTWEILVLFIVIAAGDAIDRKGGSNRGTSLWLMLRGALHPSGGRTGIAQRLSRRSALWRRARGNGVSIGALRSCNSIAATTWVLREGTRLTLSGCDIADVFRECRARGGTRLSVLRRHLAGTVLRSQVDRHCGPRSGLWPDAHQSEFFTAGRSVLGTTARTYDRRGNMGLGLFTVRCTYGCPVAFDIGSVRI